MATEQATENPFPYWGPRQGFCTFCGKHLGSYWNKYIERDTGRLGCEEHNCYPSPYEDGKWDHYSDG